MPFTPQRTFSVQSQSLSRSRICFFLFEATLRLGQLGGEAQRYSSNDGGCHLDLQATIYHAEPTNAARLSPFFGVLFVAGIAERRSLRSAGQQDPQLSNQRWGLQSMPTTPRPIVQFTSCDTGAHECVIDSTTQKLVCGLFSSTRSNDHFRVTERQISEYPLFPVVSGRVTHAWHCPDRKRDAGERRSVNELR